MAYYPFVDGDDAHHTWDGTPESMTTTEGRDGGTAIVLDAERWESVWLPWEAIAGHLGDADRTVCLWARIDEWKGGCLFYYGGDSSLQQQRRRRKLARRRCKPTNGATVGGGRITGVLPGEFCAGSPTNPMARTGPGMSYVHRGGSTAPG